MKLMIRHKIILLAVSLILIPLATMLILTSIQKEKVTKKVSKEMDLMIKNNFNQISENVYALCQTANNLIQIKVTSDLNVARDILNAHGSIQTLTQETNWVATNQYTKETKEITLPSLQIGQQALKINDDPTTPMPVVDEVQGIVGGTCTIFQKMSESGDMLRVATNVKTSDGLRAIGTYIPAINPDGQENPVIATIKRGETYYGRAYVVNAWYITAYEPIYDNMHKLIGVLYVGVKQESVESLRKSIMDITVGETGYVFILGGKGNQRGDYIISKNGKRDGENIWNAKDADGRLFIQDMIHHAVDLGPDGVTFERYPWKNADDKKVRYKMSAIKYFAPWDWVIGAGTYEDEFGQTEHKITNAISDLMKWLMLSSIIIFAVGIIVALRLSKAISDPINRTIAFIQQNEGDLTKRLDILSSDETGEFARWFNQFMKKLHDILMQVKISTEDVVTAVHEISATSTQLANGSDNQSHQVATMAASIQEMSASISENAETASKTTEIATEANTIAKEGSQAIQETENGIAEIVTSASQMGDIIASLTGRAEQIDNVVQVINEIADQTNLLALNAAIEAARAGEQGRGFAVVADEVRKLAERTTQATQEIANTISSIQEDTQKASISMDESQTAVAKGQKSINRAATVFENVITSFSQVMDRIQQVAAASEEQSSGSEIISENVDAINSIIQQSAASSEQLASTAEQLNKQAVLLNDMFNQFVFEN